MEGITVVLSQDRMAAFIRLSLGPVITMQDLRDALSREGVNTGISPILLQEALNGQRGLFYQVATGRKPDAVREGATGGVHTVWTFPSSQGRPPESLTVDSGFREAFRRLRARGTVNSGDVLAFVRNAHMYPKGLTVTGEEVACIEFSEGAGPGRNTTVSYDGTRVIATRPGIPYKDAEGHGVLDHIEVLGDVCNLTGDVSFPGDVSVRGNIEPGFRVSATGGVLVSGNVHGSVTTKGRLVVSGGINAPGESVEAGEGVICRFMENAVVRSSGRITVNEAVIHSIVESEDVVEVLGLDGKVVGGLVRATRGVTVATAGSAMGLPTIIQLGVSPKLRREQARLERELERNASELVAANRVGTRRIRSTRDYEAIRQRRLRSMLEEQTAALRQELALLEDSFRRSPRGYIRAGRILPGVRLVMGSEVTEFVSPHDRISMGAIPHETD